jgi:hypothetical protein
MPALRRALTGYALYPSSFCVEELGSSIRSSEQLRIELLATPPPMAGQRMGEPVAGRREATIIGPPHRRQI